MRFEERILAFINGLIELIIQNMWSVIFIVWAITSVFDLGGIMFDVKRDDKQTRVSVETPIEKKDEGPKPSF